MPVIVNLFSELHTERKAHRRDLAVVATQTLVGCLVLAAVLAAASWLASTLAHRALRGASYQWEKVGDTYGALVSLNKRGVRLEEQGQLLVARMRNRILWAPILASLADEVPDDAQVTKLTCERRTVSIPPDPATLLRGDGKAPATRAQMEELIRDRTRHVRGVQIVLEGLAHGERAELVVDAFRTDLQRFSVGEEFEGKVRLGPLGTVRLGAGSGSAVDVKRFMIECVYEERDDGGA